MPPALINQFRNYIKIMDKHDFYNDNVIDIDNCNFLSPTIVLPLVSLVFNHDKSLKEHKNKEVNDYLLRVLGLRENKDTTLPFRFIEKSEDNSTELTKEIISIMNPSKENTNALKFIFYEMIANVYDHSRFNKGLVMGQYYPNVNITDYCFMDNGISIPGSFKEFGYEFRNDCEAIVRAVNGLSTKEDDDGYVERGTGLNNTVNIVTNGGRGSVLIASGNGLVQIKKNGVIVDTIPDNYIDGTLISLRLRDDKINISENLGKVKYDLPKKFKR